MATILSRRKFSPTTLLYAFVVLTQFAFGLYLGQQIQPPPAYALPQWAAQLWIIGWWLRSDSRKRNVEEIYDLGLFLIIAWPIVVPYYLLKTRGAKGLLVIFGFIAAYLGATVAGILVSVGAGVLNDQQ